MKVKKRLTVQLDILKKREDFPYVFFYSTFHLFSITNSLFTFQTPGAFHAIRPA